MSRPSVTLLYHSPDSTNLLVRKSAIIILPFSYNRKCFLVSLTLPATTTTTTATTTITIITTTTSPRLTPSCTQLCWLHRMPTHLSTYILIFILKDPPRSAQPTPSLPTPKPPCAYISETDMSMLMKNSPVTYIHKYPPKHPPKHPPTHPPTHPPKHPPTYINFQVLTLHEGCWLPCTHTTSM
ncbi:hypothetical protein BZA05DRAFT_57284 [Tricharina praecox]|uniref:uncharacterized protein n=1 Tax=Tricharina praecox TaxID=43433 RepID=UPI00221E57F6|nr:uncharacterized protein BZA05DRAFT_57284 [Tricharina praecox]KAI5851042.1 hypothetical protein BZA05DRAFT_57284 [Tricharina praecox]